MNREVARESLPYQSSGSYQKLIQSARLAPKPAITFGASRWFMAAHWAPFVDKINSRYEALEVNIIELPATHRFQYFPNHLSGGEHNFNFEEQKESLEL